MSTQPTDNLVRIIIVDQHPLAREGIRASLSRHGQMNVVAEAGDATAALLAGKKHGHDVLLINSILPEVNIFQATAEHKKAFSNVHIVISYAPEEPTFIMDLLEGGIRGLIGQEAASGEYIAAISAVIAEGSYLSTNLLDCIINQKKSYRNKANVYNLTDRETEILSMLALGMSNKEVANKLNLSVRTAEAHRLSIRRKTEANTLSDLIRIARTFGLSDPLSSHRTKYGENTNANANGGGH